MPRGSAKLVIGQCPVAGVLSRLPKDLGASRLVGPAATVVAAKHHADRLWRSTWLFPDLFTL